MQSGLSVLIPIFLPQNLREAYFLAMVLFLKMSLQLSRTLAVPGIAQPREHFLLFYSDIFKRERKNHKETQMCLCLYTGFLNPLEAELDAHSLALCLSLFQSVSVTEIAPDFRSWWMQRLIGFVEAVHTEPSSG